MKVEDYVIFLELGRKMEWFQKKRASVVWMEVQNKVGWSRKITNLSGNGRSVTRGVYNVALSRSFQTM
jgi:hypothetical protein